MGDTAASFADGEGETSRDLLPLLFVRKGNRFSYQFVNMIEVDNAVCGFLLAYPASRMASLELRTGLHLLELLGFRKMVRFTQKMMTMMNVREAERGEYYISNIAVLPKFQGKGLGVQLMSFAERQACVSGLKRCSLIVDASNAVAIRFYERIGYKIVFSGTHKDLYHRMVKELT